MSVRDSTPGLSSSKPSFMLYTGGLLTKRSFLILTRLLILLAAWFEGSSKPTKWIVHCFRVPTEGWKGTAPWAKKFRFSIKVNVYLKPCIHLKSENEYWKWGCRRQNFFIYLFIYFFWNLAFQNGKMDEEWTDFPLRNIPPS